MKIFVVGTRGIPNIPGGVEKHCQELYPRIAALGCEVTVFTRSPYITDPKKEWRKVKLLHCFAPRKKSLEAIIHTALAVVRARLNKPDILHIHAVGPSLMVPLARLMGLRVVTTNHGPDYDRQKWGFLAKASLKLGERLGGRFSTEVIVISEVIADIVRKRCNRNPHLIYNGVDQPKIPLETDYLKKIGTKPNSYILAVARFVPEKGLHELIGAFNDIGWNGNLVIAGDADHESAYSRELKASAKADERIILTGYISGEPLGQLYSNARLFVLPSHHEGLPIALLEAMSYGLPALVSDIPANIEIGLPAEQYFRCADMNNLKERLLVMLDKKNSKEERELRQEATLKKYNWDKISEQTIGVYRKALGG